MPSAPPAIFTAPAAPTPSAAGAVHASPSASPAAAAVVHASPGIPTPSAPGAVHVVPVVGGGGILVTGTFTRGDNGQPVTIGALLESGTYGGKPYWSSDGLAQGVYRSADYAQIFYVAGQSKYYLEGRLGVTGDAVYYAGSEVTSADDPTAIIWDYPAYGGGAPTVTSAAGLATPATVHAYPGIPTPTAPPVITP